jgi:hypothetical protein
VEYHFTCLSETDHPADAVDEAFVDYETRFDCIDREGRVVVENFKPTAADPVIKEVKEVTISHLRRVEKVEKQES